MEPNISVVVFSKASDEHVMIFPDKEGKSVVPDFSAIFVNHLGLHLVWGALSEREGGMCIPVCCPRHAIIQSWYQRWVRFRVFFSILHCCSPSGTVFNSRVKPHYSSRVTTSCLINNTSWGS